MPRPRPPANDDVGLDSKVAFLASPAAYAERPAHVEQIETHFSRVFLTERHVYKLKKPIRADGLDFTSLAARRRNAEAELWLNRRLAHLFISRSSRWFGTRAAAWPSAAREGLSIGWSRWSACRPPRCSIAVGAQRNPHPPRAGKKARQSPGEPTNVAGLQSPVGDTASGFAPSVG